MADKQRAKLEQIKIEKEREKVEKVRDKGWREAE